MNLTPVGIVESARSSVRESSRQSIYPVATAPGGPPSQIGLEQGGWLTTEDGQDIVTE